MFWSERKKFLEESVGTAVDDRRHGEVTHLAKAISVGDLCAQVEAKYPDGTPIPRESWIRLQFWPKTQHAKLRIHYTGKLDIRFMVQARQFRKTHPDSHYAVALFRYQRNLLCDSKTTVCSFRWMTSIVLKWVSRDFLSLQWSVEEEF